MEIEDKRIRIAVGTGLIIVGGILMGPAMNRILQLEPAPWWAVLLLVIGGLAIIVGLLILIIPPRNWRHVWFSIIHCRYGIKKAYIWWFRGPQWSSSKPIISLDEVTPSSVGQTNYTATLSLTIKNRDDYTLEGALYSLAVNIEQGSGRRRVRCILRPNPSYQIRIEQHDEETYPLVLLGTCYSARQLDIEKPYDNWGIQGITVGLSGAGYKDLHRGLYIKPPRQEHIGII